MTGEPETDRRSRWRKNRSIAAGLLCLTVAYLLASGPAGYAVTRGWIPGGAFDLFTPIRHVWGWPVIGPTHAWYHREWVIRSFRDRGSRVVVHPDGSMSVWRPGAPDGPAVLVPPPGP